MIKIPSLVMAKVWRADVLQSEVGGSAMSDERQAVPWSPSFDPSDVEDDPRGREAQS